MKADDIPVQRTPEGGWTEMPPPILDDCTEPLPDGVPDLRGLWRSYDVRVSGEPVPEGFPLLDHVERIEQCGNRLIVVSSGVVHDMRCDGTVDNGVHDIAGPTGMEIHVVATFEDGVHVLRPVGMEGIEVTRHLEGDDLVWKYGPVATSRLRRIDESRARS